MYRMMRHTGSRSADRAEHDEDDADEGRDERCRTSLSRGTPSGVGVPAVVAPSLQPSTNRGASTSCSSVSAVSSVSDARSSEFGATMMGASAHQSPGSNSAPGRIVTGPSSSSQWAAFLRQGAVPARRLWRASRGSGPSPSANSNSTVRSSMVGRSLSRRSQRSQSGW